MNYETIDLDYCPLDRAAEILAKIQKRGCKIVYVGLSPSLNGYHVVVRCKCGACRLVFDDPVRFAKDMRRPPHARNVLFHTRRRKLYLTSRNTLPILKK